MLEGLGYCHLNGVTHRDLKPENLLIGSDYTLKIADFGFAAPAQGKDGSGMLNTKVGTPNYMAPEIHLDQPYDGKDVDLFASAIILFIMVVGSPPFTTATPDDPYYRALASNQLDLFWSSFCSDEDP